MTVTGNSTPGQKLSCTSDEQANIYRLQGRFKWPDAKLLHRHRFRWMLPGTHQIGSRELRGERVPCALDLSSRGEGGREKSRAFVPGGKISPLSLSPRPPSPLLSPPLSLSLSRVSFSLNQFETGALSVIAMKLCSFTLEKFFIPNIIK